MIYQREEYIEEGDEKSKFPVKEVVCLKPVGEGKPKYIGQVALGLGTPMGVQQIPISFEIEAATVQEAFAKFETAAQPRIEEARKGIEEEIRRLRREQSSRIVRPSEVGLGGANLAGGLGGAPGGSGAKIINFNKLKE